MSLSKLDKKSLSQYQGILNRERNQIHWRQTVTSLTPLMIGNYLGGKKGKANLLFNLTWNYCLLNNITKYINNKNKSKNKKI